VPEGHRRLLTETSGQLDLVRREVSLARALDEHQHSHGLVIRDQRDVEAGLLAIPIHGGAHIAREALVGDRLLNDQALAQHLAVGRVLVEGVGRPDPVVLVGGRIFVPQSTVHDGVPRGIVLVDHTLGGGQRLGRLAADQRQHIFEHHRGRERPAGVEERGQMAVLLFLLPVEARVVDGGGGRDGEQRGKVLVVFAEMARAALLDQRQAADDAALEDERHGEGGELAPFDHQLAIGRIHDFVIGVGFTAPAVDEDRPVAVAVLQGDRRTHPVDIVLGHVRRPGGRGDDRLTLGIILVEVALPHAHGLGDTVRDRREHILEDERGRDRGAHLAGERIVVTISRASGRCDQSSASDVPPLSARASRA